ncbi:MAG: biopolymer transporter ExbD [Candidatus Aminicenantes bacterium]|uniref:Biopolymer transport protein ExbD/TolR n=1 Tax=Candidatus Saccharicenans subterraneus TaxID=2508984 RepID=A0A3E2BLG2_9BACT|nr:biopolymer transporter ExbD [Candidatus Aminicenantes bacterium]RFT15534.1 MAG: Biopolymer transport protein ExbD/TolR [Candidatus Saccharicenans subterraneum]
MGFTVSMGGKETVKSEPNVVPLCDVLLVLLIIFMVVTPLVQKGVDVQLPSALNTTQMPDNPDVVLSIKADGTLFLKEQRVTLEGLTMALEEAFLQAAEKKLYIRADANLEFGKMIDVIDMIREAGIELVGIITERKATEGE